MAPIQIVLLLSLGSFQAHVPGVSKTSSPIFEDNQNGAKAFTAWAKSTVGEPRFNQPPHQICVVGAQEFADKMPFISELIWKSQMPVRQLEPYAATFHYVEPGTGKNLKKPRTMKQAVEICSAPAKR